jgi:trehalose 6-phosphate synthase
MVWVHGHKLQLVPGILRRIRPDLRIGLHLETPFPAAERFRYLPMHRGLVRGLLGADLLGFQSADAAENFLRLLKDVTSASANVGVFATAADTGAARALASRSDIAARVSALRSKLGNPRTVVLSMNRADDAQGTERRMQVLGDMFRDGQLNSADTVVIQLMLGPNNVLGPPSWDGVARAAARVNGEHSSVGRPCVHCVAALPDLAERVVLYLTADAMLATPLREGSTTCALEFAACAREDAVLVISEFSGTAAFLSTACVVNPYDDEAVKAGLRASAPVEQRVQRMRGIRDYVTNYDSFAWARNFLSTLRTVPARNQSQVKDPSWISRPVPRLTRTSLPAHQPFGTE